MIEIVTKNELYELRDTILEKLDQIANRPTTTNIEKRWLKSSDVKQLLGISHGKLQKMRDREQIKFTRIDGVIFYLLSDIETLMRNHK